MKEELLAQCEKTIDKCILDALSSYSSPLVEAVKSALKDQEPLLKEMAKCSVDALLNSQEFRDTMNSEMRKKLARVLISQYGGELEKSVGKLKADPTTRAKITIAIDGVLDGLIK